MFSPNKLLIINLKNYYEIAGNNSVKIVKEAKKAAIKNQTDIVVAPPQSSILAVAKIKIPIIGQHVDDIPAGATTGFIVPEILKSHGAIGSIINHSEHKISLIKIKNLVKRLHRLDMISIVCAAEIREVSMLSRLCPDFLAIEPPELIGSGVAVSKVNPSIITDSLKVVKRNSSTTKFICGAGIIEKSDVEIALELGAEGILISSGIVKSPSWYEKISELCSVLK